MNDKSYAMKVSR